MNSQSLPRSLVVLTHAAVGWALCSATMGIGLTVSTLQPSLVVHAIAAPIYFFGVSLVYHKRFGYTTPLQTAIAFTGFVVAVDFLLVALVINRNLAMFASPLGTWIPFAFIFTSTWVTGLRVTRRASLAPNVARATSSPQPQP